ncbi:beta-ketoacyl-[acyl-carrier-protein] synthase family protein [Sinomonas sp. JGH33]|uniref:Beta-ketoacyl-[acyl-carrier-protein] synthase family protein n=1 Tax=Sinomonas terricola TaxID=3110330 RepID=A0ABU5T3I7_9MICC|nr:beta-ketoacyl-[acyl-carrier-protein] synthase family protein [Sinomonas sp. JGH33]MEA5453696.1 beta-ketoacyl-[acyl-carrier-protein] synthase family protein [Sinomonas sp. JGH33]
MTRIVITGMGCVSPFGAGVDSLKEGILSARTAFGPVRKFDGTHYGINAAAEIPEDVDLSGLDGSRPSRLLRLAAEEARADARLGPDELRDAAIVLGTTLGSDEISSALWHRTHGYKPDYAAVMRSMSECGGRALVDLWKIAGPCLTVITACAAGTNAIGLGVDLIRAGRAERVLVGGLDTLTQLIYGGFASIGALGSACRPFAEESHRRGTVLGENAAVLVLETADRAIERDANIHAEVLGYGLSNDAHHMTAPEPEGRGATLAMRRCLDHSGLAPEDIDYVNAHGTGTRLNDPVEVAALREVFGHGLSAIPVSSLKSQIGHGLSSAGAIEAIATVLALEEQFLPPTAHTAPPLDPDIDFVREPRPSPGLRRAMSNSFAFGGHNASVAFAAWVPGSVQSDAGAVSR